VVLEPLSRARAGDIESIDYSYSFDPQLEAEWAVVGAATRRSRKILRYLEYVADKHDLRRDILFKTRVAAAKWNEGTSSWTVSTHQGWRVALPLLRHGHGMPVAAQGSLTSTVTGAFLGRSYYTNRWPHEGVDFSGKACGRDRHRVFGRFSPSRSSRNRPLN